MSAARAAGRTLGAGRPLATAALRAAPAVAPCAAARLGTQLGPRLGCALRCSPSAAPRSNSSRRRRGGQPTRAMVNVDVSPSVVLGVGLIGAGVSLWQIRRVKPWISKDYDVVVSCISLLVGGILIFQGWRLDPLLLFGQLMTTGAAVSFAIEALRLRGELYQGEEQAALQDVFRNKGPGGGGGGAFQLPPPEAPAAGGQPWAAGQQWAPPPPGAQQQAYDYSQQPAAGGAYGYRDTQQQAQQPWDGYGGGGIYQPAEYEAPPGDGLGGPGGPGAGEPTEFTFPASYADPGAAYGDAQQPQQPGQAPPAGQQPGSSGRSGQYDSMEDW